MQKLNLKNARLLSFTLFDCVSVERYSGWMEISLCQLLRSLEPGGAVHHNWRLKSLVEFLGNWMKLNKEYSRVKGKKEK